MIEMQSKTTRQDATNRQRAERQIQNIEQPISAIEQSKQSRLYPD